MPAPVRHTCPDIDKIIKRIKSALTYADEGKGITEKNTEEWSRFDYITDELYGVEYELENLRSSNSSLRDWGEELELQLSKSEETVYELEEKVKELIYQ